MRYVTILLITVCVNFSKAKQLNISTLQQLQIIFRHGDRPPNTILYFPTDPPEIRTPWPAEMGELTPLGVQQMYKLGQNLHKHYGPFLGEYLPSKMQNIAGDNNRTISSAIAVLASLFPVEKTNAWNSNLLWQPIPVKADKMIDKVTLDLIVTCPTALPKIYTSQQYKDLKNQTQELMAFIQANSGYPLNNLIDLEHALDNLVARSLHQDTNPLPEWSRDPEIYSQYPGVRSQIHSLVVGIPDVFDVTGGWFMDEIVARAKTFQANQTLHKLVLLSGHDTSIRAVAIALNCSVLRPDTHIGLGAWLALEFHQIHGIPYVQLKYSNGVDIEPEIIPISRCPHPCSFRKFSRLVELTTRREWRIKCGLPVEKGYNKERGIISLLLVLAILLAISTVITCIDYFNIKRVIRENNPLSRPGAGYLRPEDDN